MKEDSGGKSCGGKRWGTLHSGFHRAGNTRFLPARVLLLIAHWILCLAIWLIVVVTPKRASWFSALLELELQAG